MTAITPLQRWTRDDWSIACTLQDASGTPINLVGTTIGAELWLAGYSVFSPLSVANGGIVRTSDVAGQFSVNAPRLVTSGARADAGRDDVEDLTRILIYAINTLGRRQTLGVIPFEVFDGSEALAVNGAPAVTLVSQSTSLTLVVAAEQGPPGPSNIGAAQINDASAVGRNIVKATDASAVRTLLSLPSIGRHAVNDTNYSVAAADTYVALTALTAPRTITLPFADAYPLGQALWIADESGACSTEAPIIVAAAGGTTIAGQPNVVLASPFQKLAFHSNGTNLWTI